MTEFSSGGCAWSGVGGEKVWQDKIYLSLANTLYSYEKAENASECCEWRSVLVRGRDVRVRQNVVERCRIV